ncbi:PGF-CTERM sorting domain-containing protein [Natrarchaeobius sp. A-rgal3]|uniref:PGF-CTERM sorting domain-containing protein n=1 Tax=Natrarchaeobius versutus TaxID=1679078 RepID=UPI003510C0B9
MSESGLSGTGPNGRSVTVWIGAIGGVVLLAAAILVVAFGVGPAGTMLEEDATAETDVTESAAEHPVPEPGDPYFEDRADDGSWVSYLNPRDEYRDPYLGEGSGKICVALLNEAGEPIVGESVPETTVTIPTGESIAWHTNADPFVVEYPLTDHYTRPFDGDQFGTNPDFPQGDGYFDSHCLEWHGLPEDETVEYGEARIDGDGADDVELVGYVQQTHETWDTDVDPIADAEPYEATGGAWTYEPDGSHGQVVVVLQLSESTDASPAEASDQATTDG